MVYTPHIIYAIMHLFSFAAKQQAVGKTLGVIITLLLQHCTYFQALPYVSAHGSLLCSSGWDQVSACFLFHIQTKP